LHNKSVDDKRKLLTSKVSFH